MNEFFTYDFDQEKAKQIIFYILDNLKEINELDLYKIVHIADNVHLAKYGQPISTDQYLWKNGIPVPVGIELIVKNHLYDPEHASLLSESDIDSLNFAITDYKNGQFSDYQGLSRIERWALSNFSIDGESLTDKEVWAWLEKI